MELLTNRNSRGDFIRTSLINAAEKGEAAYIASAFFTDHEVLRQIGRRSQQVRLVVRLGFPTSPRALEDALSDPFVDVRYFTSESFHPKLYIFGDRCAYVGSANLTAQAMISNQEIMVSLDAGDPRFTELASLFADYWNEARVLTSEILKAYKSAYDKHKAADAEVARLDEAVEAAVGSVVFANIDRGRKKESKENIFVEGFRKTYQEAVTAFNAIREQYVAYGKRKLSEDVLPLRLEIDSFFSFVRDHIAVGETWREIPLGWTQERKEALRLALGRWHSLTWDHLESTIVHTNYPCLIRVFRSAETIEQASNDELFQGLLTLHSFHDSLRFHNGGLPGLKKAFLESNDPAQLRRSLAYLVHGPGDLVKRMADLIYSSSYKLNVFGRANVQELVGWHNNQELPVVNGRTTKILRFSGFDVRQL